MCHAERNNLYGISMAKEADEPLSKRHRGYLSMEAGTDSGIIIRVSAVQIRPPLPINQALSDTGPTFPLFFALR